MWCVEGKVKAEFRDVLLFALTSSSETLLQVQTEQETVSEG